MHGGVGQTGKVYYALLKFAVVDECIPDVVEL